MTKSNEGKALTNDEERQYADLAERAERGELHPIGRPTRGAEAAAEGRSLIMEATGASSVEEAFRLALGRPPVAEAGRGPSPTWRLRTSPELDDAVRRVAQKRGVPVALVIREAVAQYVAAGGNSH
ncbi:MAG: hypothetical protein K0U42_08980 [Actinomycetia bacterium]|nr:hypothetical protein [Actinomycetes bacterium]